MWFIGVEVEQETSAPPPKKNPGSAPEIIGILLDSMAFVEHSVSDPRNCYECPTV